MPSHLSRLLIALGAALAAAPATLCGCANTRAASRPTFSWYSAQPDAQQSPTKAARITGPRVLALGNLRCGQAPSETRQALSEFFLGERIESGPGLVKPGAMAWQQDGLLVSDAGLGTLVRWPSAAHGLQPAVVSDESIRAAAVAACEKGEFLVAIPASAAVHRYDARGRLVRRYLIPSEFRPMGAAQIGRSIWVTNAARHNIEVFDSESGSSVRAIGQRGRGPGEFNLPMGIAALPKDHPLADGGAVVVDSFNARVQVLDSSGRWVRDLGGPGDVTGRFGRPIGVAVGPDGAIFVLDAASQRVHAFDERGNALLAFGRQTADSHSLLLPGGVCVVPVVAEASALRREAGVELRPAYYIMVSEQLNRPGIRAYAWFTDAAGRLAP